MRVVKGDVIGTTDNRYGTIIDIQDGVITVAEAARPGDPCPTEVSVFTIRDSEVASVV